MTIQVPQWQGDPQRFVADLFTWYETVGASNYDEQVTQLAHALQTAAHARQNGASDLEIGAALLHDVGHFLVREHRQQGDFLKRDLQHETVGAAWLRHYFPPALAQLVRLHVPAKRWLCTTDAAYWNGLSDASKRSLEVQGGRMRPDEVAAFEAEEGWQAAVALRQYDDLGKQCDLDVPGLDSYRELLLELLTPPGPAKGAEATISQ
jgi:phosphonate degradation associated HDIG domain protein